MPLDPSLSLLLADAVLVVHACIAAFVVGGLVFVVVGNLGHWSAANNGWFRSAHVAAIGIVVAESWLGLVCPLTSLEMWLRSRAGAAAYGGAFVEHWLQRLLFYSAPPWVFVAVYMLFAMLVLASWWYFPPRFEHRSRDSMQALELRIPPPVCALLVAAAMWAISYIAPPVGMPAWVRAATATALAVAGGAFSLAGLIAFRRARTTVNPMKPQAASSLVRSGVYRFTRNPMYVGLLLVLVAWAVFLSSPWALLGPLAFAAYMGRFQIAPEERALAALFGDEYSAYQAKVRRWL